MKTTAQDGTKNTTTLSYINPDAQASTMKTYAQKLASLTTDSYTSSTRVDKTDLDQSADKTPRGMALYTGNEGDDYDTYVAIQPAISKANITDKAFDVRYQGQDPCYVSFGKGGNGWTAEMYGGETLEGAAASLYAGVAWSGISMENSTNFIITVRVDETDTHQAGELQITVTGGNT